MAKRLLHTPEGVRDIYGGEYRRKLGLEEKLHQCMHRYGYQDIQTPTFEFFDVFSREIGTTPSRELYKFFDKEGNTLVLRPDFTPSVARCAAKYYMEEKLPIRFSYAGNTFTNTSSLQGKLKESTQVGVELIQEPSVYADAEMVALCVECLLASGLEEFTVSCGHVEYFKGLCSQAGLDEETEEELRELISSKNFFGAQELLEAKRVRRDYCEILLRVCDLAGSYSVLEEAKGMVNNERSLQAVERLQELYTVLCEYGVERYVSFDLGSLSKYHYYTGMVFKAYTYGVGGCIAKGGRYDDLLGYFGKQAPATGFVIVVDDLLEALVRQKKTIPDEPDGVLVLYEPDSFKRALLQATKLRSASVPVELVPVVGPGKGRSVAEPFGPYLKNARAHHQNRIYYYADDGGLYEKDVNEAAPTDAAAAGR